MGADEDDLARARRRRREAAAPEYPSPRPRVPKARTTPGSLHANVPITHVVEQAEGRAWKLIQQASQRNCEATLELLRRHYPQNTYRLLTIEEAQRDRRRKTWSVHDPDHVPDGSRVLVVRLPHAKSGEEFARAFGLEPPKVGAAAVVTHRYRRSGSYMVKITGTNWAVHLERDDFVFPVHENVVALAPRSR